MFSDYRGLDDDSRGGKRRCSVALSLIFVFVGVCTVYASMNSTHASENSVGQDLESAPASLSGFLNNYDLPKDEDEVEQSKVGQRSSYSRSQRESSSNRQDPSAKKISDTLKGLQVLNQQSEDSAAKMTEALNEALKAHAISQQHCTEEVQKAKEQFKEQLKQEEEKEYQQQKVLTKEVDSAKEEVDELNTMLAALDKELEDKNSKYTKLLKFYQSIYNTAIDNSEKAQKAVDDGVKAMNALDLHYKSLPHKRRRRSRSRSSYSRSSRSSYSRSSGSSKPVTSSSRRGGIIFNQNTGPLV